MIRLCSINIIGFKDRRRSVSIDFSKEPITVIYGKNGSGKSTLLKIIQAVLSKNGSILSEEKVSKVELKYTYYSAVQFPNGVDKEVAVWLQSAHDEPEKLVYNWEQFEIDELNDLSSILFGVHRGTSVSPTNLDIDSLSYFIQRSLYSRYFENRSRIESFADDLVSFINRDTRARRRIGRSSFSLNKKHVLFDNVNIKHVEELLVERYREAKYVSSQRVQKALFDTLSIAINPAEYSVNRSELPDSFLELLEENRDRLIDALSSTAENTLRDQIIHILRDYNREEFLTRHIENELLSNLLYNMILELDSERSILNSINILVNAFNDQVSDWKKLVVTQDEAFVRILGSQRHSLNELSSGERHLLSFLAMFIIEGTRRDILIVDEPEISLNIKWQRELLPMLSDLAPNAQIIVASHSASIARKNTNYLVELKDNFNFYEIDELGSDQVETEGELNERS